MRIIALLALSYLTASASAQSVEPGDGADPPLARDSVNSDTAGATAGTPASPASEKKYKVAKDLSDKVQAFLTREDFAKALAAVDEALAAEKDNAELYRLRATIDCRAADYKTCLADATKAIDTDHDYVPAYLFRAMAHIDAGSAKDGIADCDAVVRLTPDHAQGYNCRGVVNRSLGAYTQAILDFDAAASRDNKFDLAPYNKGLTYALLKKPDEAIMSFTAAIAVNEAFTESYAQRGKARVGKGDVEGARADFRKALSLNGHNFTAAVGMQALQTGKALDKLNGKN